MRDEAFALQLLSMAERSRYVNSALSRSCAPNSRA